MTDFDTLDLDGVQKLLKAARAQMREIERSNVKFDIRGATPANLMAKEYYRVLSNDGEGPTDPAIAKAVAAFYTFHIDPSGNLSLEEAGSLVGVED